MFISNGNSISSQITQMSSASLATSNTNKPSALNSSMITRIHNVRPGCGSCGRK